jgi:hypothetical protein
LKGGYQMRNGFLGSTLVLVAFALPAVLLAQTAKPTGAVTNKPDLSGIWNRGIGRTAAGIFDDDAGCVPFHGFTKQDPPMQTSAMKIYQANRTGVTDPRLKGRDDSDPSNSCFPPGPTRIFTAPRPFEIRQTAEVVYILSEVDHWVRRIYMDGRGHPDGYPTTWMGHSIPKAYTRPWTGKKVYQLQPPTYELKEDVICEEYRKSGLRNDGFEFIKP